MANDTIPLVGVTLAGLTNALALSTAAPEVIATIGWDEYQ